MIAQMRSDGQAQGSVLSVYVIRDFERGDKVATQDWRLSTGLMRKTAHPGFRRGGAAGADVLLQETAIDMLLTERFYLVGTAGTAMQGDAAGYAIGMLGLGYTIPLCWNLHGAVEAHLGAAGGGSIDVTGGGVMGLRVELDFSLSSDLALTLALGKLRSAKAGGMAPLVVQAGIKIDFQTN